MLFLSIFNSYSPGEKRKYCTDNKKLTDFKKQSILFLLPYHSIYCRHVTPLGVRSYDSVMTTAIFDFAATKAMKIPFANCYHSLPSIGEELQIDKKNYVGAIFLIHKYVEHRRSIINTFFISFSFGSIISMHVF